MREHDDPEARAQALAGCVVEAERTFAALLTRHGLTRAQVERFARRYGEKDAAQRSKVAALRGPLARLVLRSPANPMQLCGGAQLRPPPMAFRV
jgi:hypothetical protein